MKRFLLAALFLLIASPAFAACPTTSLTFKDAAGTTQTLCFGGAAGAYIPQYQLLDAGGTNAAAILGASTSPSASTNALAVSVGPNSVIPLPSNAAQETGGNLATTVSEIGALGSTACATDTGSCNLNALIQRVNQRLTTINSTLGSPFQTGGTVAATQSGNWTSRVVGNAGATLDFAIGGAAAPTNALAVGGEFLTTLPTLGNGQSSGLMLDNKGELIISPSTITIAQGAATSGQTGSLVMGAATTGAPTDTTGNSYPLSLDTSGNLRINCITGCGTGTVNPTTPANWGIGATGSAVPANAQFAGAVASGNLAGLIQADHSAAINVSTATTTQIVALSAAKSIYVTSLNVIAGGTGNITFEYGTGSTCGTGTTALTGAYPLTAQNGLALGSGVGPVLVVPAGDALCVLTSASVQMSGSISYTQF